MHTWLDAGTDVATLAAWDAQLQESPLDAERWAHPGTLEAEAAEARVVLINTGGDGGGRIDVFVDEPASLPGIRPVAKEPLLLHVPSGRLLIGGAEDYRSPKPQITSEKSITSVAAGDYAVRCFEPLDLDAPISRELAEAAGISADDWAYWTRLTAADARRSNLGCALLLIFPVLLFIVGWKFSLAITALASGAWVVLGKKLARHAGDERFHAIETRVHGFYEQIPETALVIELTRLHEPGSLRGGAVNLFAE